MNWEQPHWSGRAETAAGPRQKLRPNGFARMARFCATHALSVVLASLLIAGLCAGFAASRLSIDPDQRPRIALDVATEKLQGALDQKFPGVEQTFLAVITGRDPDAARQQAEALAAGLRGHRDVFISAFVPGTGAFYEANALLYRDADEVHARIDGLLQLEPLYHALAAAPDIMGFTALVTEIGKSVEQGRSPPGLEAVLLTASATIESQVKGKPHPLDWAALAGLDAEAKAKRWYVLATPVPGMEREAAAVARGASANITGVNWLWPRRALAAAPSQLRDFVVPASLSALLTLVLLSATLGSIRQALPVMLVAAVTLAASAAVAAALGRALDGATWSFALAVLAPAIVSGGILAIAYGRGRSRGLAPLQAVMLAAHRQGGFVSATILLFAAVWASWLVRQLPSLNQFAVLALAGCAVTWIAAVTLLPAALSLAAAREAERGPHWLDDALGEHGTRSAYGVLDFLAMAVIAAALFSAVFIPAVRFGERQLPSSPPPLLETPDARGAVNILAKQDDVPALVARLSALPEVGAIRTAQQFLPPDAEAKIAEFRRLDALTPFEPVFRARPDDATLGDSFTELEEQLGAIANGSASSPDLRDAAMRLRRAVALYTGSQAPTGQRVAVLEQALFGNLGSVWSRAQKLTELRAPTVSDLDPPLLSRFVAADGTWRIEVMPRSGIGELSFAAALRRAVPQSAGEPVVSLVRNEMIHHEAILALAAGLVAAAILVLAALRSLQGLVLSLTPAMALLTLSASITVILDISLNAALLAGVSAALAVLVACSMLVARRLAPSEAPGTASLLPLRAVLLPPLTLAGAAAPLVISTRPAVAELGAALALLMLIAALLSILLVPAMARWLEALPPLDRWLRLRRKS